MSEVRVKIEGLREVQEALKKLPKKATAKNVMRRVLKKRAQPFADTARDLVPVDKGALKDSIGVSTVLAKSQRRGFKKEGRDDVVVFVGAGPHPQASLQEFGTKDFRAQPYMRPAWDKHKNQTLDGIVGDMWDEIEKAAARAARKAAKAVR